GQACACPHGPRIACRNPGYATGPMRRARLRAMFDPIDFGRVATALSSPAGWIELVVVLACFAVGWTLDRRVELKSASETELFQVGLSGLNRVLMPMATLVLLLIAQVALRPWYPPFFISIALPLTVALAVIRLLVFALRRLFGARRWLPPS